MPINITKSNVLNHVHHRRQAHEKPLYLLFITCTEHNIFLHHKTCHYTIKECYVIAVLHYFLNQMQCNRIGHEFFFAAIRYNTVYIKPYNPLVLYVSVL